MGYWIFFLFQWLLYHPWILALLVAAYFARRWNLVPDPLSWAKNLRSNRRLRDEVAANPANLTARRDLARLELDRRRPQRAIEHLDVALEREPDHQELLYYKGLALYQLGKHEESLPLLVKSVESAGRVNFGEPYLVAGDALSALGRQPEAEDAYIRFCESNSSSVEGQIKLYRCLKEQNKEEEAQKVLRDAKETWRLLPAFRKRKQMRWRLRTIWHGLFG